MRVDAVNSLGKPRASSQSERVKNQQLNPPSSRDPTIQLKSILGSFEFKVWTRGTVREPLRNRFQLNEFKLETGDFPVENANWDWNKVRTSNLVTAFWTDTRANWKLIASSTKLNRSERNHSVDLTCIQLVTCNLYDRTDTRTGSKFETKKPEYQYRNGNQ